MRTKIALSLSLLVALPAVHAQEPVVANEYQLVEQRLETLGLDLYRLLVQVTPHIAEQLHQLPESIQSALSQPGNQELIVTLESLIEAAHIAIKLVKAGATFEHNEALVSLCAQATQVLEDIDVLLGGNTSDDATRGGILKVVPSLLAGVVRVENFFLCTGTAEFNPPAGTVALRVNGESTFNGDVNISGRLVVGDNNVLTTQVVNDNVLINGNLDVSGTTTLNKLNVNGKAVFDDTLDVSGTTTVNTLNVNADATFADNINMQNTNSTGSVGVINKGSIRFMHNAGTKNTFLGQSAGTFNLTGSGNVGIGFQSLTSITSGTANTAVGGDTLVALTTGTRNVGFGNSSLASNNGDDNIAIGVNVMHSGDFYRCVALGSNALSPSLNNSSDNIAIGYNAGSTAIGNNNIMIGNVGVASDANTIRFGNGSHTTCYIQGVRGVTTGGAAIPVLVDTNGQLGTISSSRRYKDNIRSIDASVAEKILALNPVEFNYKSKPATERECGLIAEEVAQLVPELVVHNQDGEVETVRYHMLPVMLLHVIKQQEQRFAALESLVNNKYEALIPMLLGAYKTLQTEHAALLARVEQLESR